MSKPGASGCARRLRKCSRNNRDMLKRRRASKQTIIVENYNPHYINNDHESINKLKLWGRTGYLHSFKAPPHKIPVNKKGKITAGEKSLGL